MSESLPSRRLLMIVDPQVDFITGTLPVPGAEAAMNDLAEYITQTNGDYTLKIVTADRHPFNHFSFKNFEGVGRHIAFTILLARLYGSHL